VAQEAAMGKINWGRVFLGGLLAGLVAILLKSAAWVLFGSRDWRAALEALGRPFQETTGFAIFWIAMFFVIGISAIWLYAAIRPRFGPGPKTAAYAGFAYWFVGVLLPEMVFGSQGLFPMRLLAIDIGTYFVIIVAATIIGAWVYKE
jgi:hypothetical protein